jgi:DNA-binding beta-propeller fold protein YncE
MAMENSLMRIIASEFWCRARVTLALGSAIRVSFKLRMRSRALVVFTLFLFAWCAVLAAADEPGRASRLVLVAGGGTDGDGAAADRAELNTPFGIDFNARGTLFFVELLGNRVRTLGPEAIRPDAKVSTIAGTGRKGSTGNGGPAVQAELNGPHSLAVAGNGDVYVADTWNNQVRKIDARSGRITAVVGSGKKGFSGDGGPATEAEFGGIYCVALDKTHQTLDLADLDNRRIRRVNLVTAIVSTIAGNGTKGVPADGADARSSPLVDPRAVTVDRRGNVYILERSGHALRVIDSAGKIRTVAGDGRQGDLGDGGDARRARLNGPKHLCVDAHGNVLIADTENHRIKIYRPDDGTIHNLAGTGKKGANGLGGPPAEAELNQPHGVALGPEGMVYIADSSNNRILKISKAW